METSVTCPSCQAPFRVPALHSEGAATCPQCGQPVAVPGAALMARVAPAARDPRRPVLLDRIGTPFVASPGFVAIAAGAVLLYGLGLFAVVSNQRPAPTGGDVGADSVALRGSDVPAPPAATPPTAPPPVVAPPPPPKEAPAPKDQSAPRESPAAPPAAPPSPTAVTPTAPAPATPASTVPAPTTPAPKTSPPTAPAAPNASTPKAAPPPAPEAVAPVKTFGAFTDPAGDCRLVADDDGLTIEVPGTLHVLSPELKAKNAPRVLTEVEGDFVAQVRVGGEIQPGPDPLEGQDFTFQGAGLLLLEDEDNYLRFERTALSAKGSAVWNHRIMAEACLDGKSAGGNFSKELPNGPLYLRIERRGNRIACSISRDGKSWSRFQRVPNEFPARVLIGVSASNLSRKPFAARLEGFDVSPVEGRKK